ncbi:MAG: biopolymer transporter ExbD [Verrucomicrobia bacterium]|nr:MAG: biopolymer transporter ExbD [Verrucomicrobiota bacterium]
MRIPRPTRKKARIEIIPMIDTMFFLLVFFMVATLSMTIQRGLPVNLPSSASAKADIPDTVSITVTAAGAVFVNKEAVSVQELRDRLRGVQQAQTEPSVVVNADEAVRYGLVVQVLDAVKQAGLTKLAIATKPIGQGSGRP